MLHRTIRSRGSERETTRMTVNFAWSGDEEICWYPGDWTGYFDDQLWEDAAWSESVWLVGDAD
eukprot:11157052-Lingulodinium_polyedra.AAC.1